MSEKGFEQIISWKKARALNKQIYGLTNKPGFSKDFGLRDQIRRAYISISSNIQASCYEVKSQLYLAFDIDYISNKEFEDSFLICDEISKTIYGLIKHLENKN